MKHIRPATKAGALRLAALVAAALFLVAAGAIAQIYETTTGVNLREGPSNDTPVIRVLNPGEKVEKIESSGNFVKVRTEKGEEGYLWASFLKRMADQSSHVPSFDEFFTGLEQGGQAGADHGPQRYFFENILEFLRIENHQLFVILLPALMTILLAVAGGILLRAAFSKIPRLLPPEISGAREKAARAIVTAAGACIVIEAMAYCLDLSLHYASLEENTALVMVIMVPRMVLAAVPALVHAAGGNWVVGAVLLLFLVMVFWPGTGNRETIAISGPDDPTLPSFQARPSPQPEPTLDETTPIGKAGQGENDTTGPDTRVVVEGEDE